MWFMIHPIGEMKQGVLFVDQSKTASTTTGEVFIQAIKQSHGHIGSYHQTSIFLRDNYPKYWNEYFKFSVVRNPFDRFISAFFFKVDQWHNNSKQIEREITEKAIFDLMKEPENKAIMPQRHYICDEKGNVIVDKLLRYETVKEETANLIFELQIPFVDFRAFDEYRLQNTNGKGDWRKYYEQYPDLWHLVSEIYREDIKLYEQIGGVIG